MFSDLSLFKKNKLKKIDNNLARLGNEIKNNLEGCKILI